LYLGQEGVEMERLTLALMADDSKKEDLISLIKTHREELAEIHLVAAKNTGEMIQSITGLPVTLLRGGRHSSDLQIGALVANGDLRAVIFLRDPLTAQPPQPDISALLYICDMDNVPLATNLAAGEAVIHLMFEHPEALSGHHLCAQYLEDVAAVYD
jgi:methylglyoxal synthase